MIIKVKKTERFTVLFNEMLQNEKLSYEARGVLSMLLSFPPDWEVKVDDLIKRGGKKEDGKNRYGRDRMYSIIKELKDEGYIVGSPKRVGGEFKGYDYCVYESPQTGPASPLPVSPDTAIPSPIPDIPDAVQPEAYTKDFLSQKNTADKPQSRRKNPVLTAEQREAYDFILSAFEAGYRKLNDGLEMPQHPKEYVAMSFLAKYFAGKIPSARAHMATFYEMIFKHDRVVDGFGFVPSALNTCLTRVAARIGGKTEQDDDALRYGSQADKDKIRDKANAEGIFDERN